MSRHLTVEPLTGTEALAGLAAEWDQLNRQISPRTPFTSPGWLIPWWEHFSRRRQRLFLDEFYFHVVRGEGGRLLVERR